MSEYFIGEIRAFPYNMVPYGWMKCEGQILSASQNPMLFSLLLNNYGESNGSTFALPDLRGRTIVGFGYFNSVDGNRITPKSASGNNLPSGSVFLPIGTAEGEESVKLTEDQLPPHSHSFVCDADNHSTMMTSYESMPSVCIKPASATTPVDAPMIYGPPGANLQPLNKNAISTTGEGGGHENRQPFLPLVYCIAVEGEYPVRE